MELWVFDRSGPYSSGEFDIHKEPEQFIRAIAGYAMMSDDELGLDTFVRRSGGDLSITIADDATGKPKQISLERAPLVIQRAIVCRGTSCYRSKDHECVVKFSWTSDKRPPEANLLRLARQRSVKGVAGLVGYHRITSIEKIRCGLAFPAPYHFRNAFRRDSVSFSEPDSQKASQSLGGLEHLSMAKTSSKRRKPSDSQTSLRKRSRSNSQRSKLCQEVAAAQPAESRGRSRSMRKGKTSQPAKSMGSKLSQEQEDALKTRKRKSVDGVASPSKRSRSDSDESILHKNHDSSQLVENTQATSLYDPCDESFNNRLFCCLAISPAGRAISKFDSISELLKALRDAIKAHRSLYLTGKILHRDISENNIIITDLEKADGFNGMLIDLDLAKEIGSKRSGARHKTGTMEFMAIQVLRQVDHTYRHDLESFFYVLLWICARRA